MDGGGRLAQPLKRFGPSRLTAPSAAVPSRRARSFRRRLERPSRAVARVGRIGVFETWLDRQADRLSRWMWPSGTGVALSALIVFGGLTYGVVRGEHVPETMAYLKDLRDMAANAAGFGIRSVALSGQKHLSREEILASAGVTGRSSLLFLDAAAARRGLESNPWIAEASVSKLYPDRLQITVTERAAFALWQHNGKVGVISADGTMLEPYVPYRLAGLPLVVGQGAETQGRGFLALLDRYPVIRDNMRAAILVAERRWNLRLKNGIDVRLPEANVAEALDLLVKLDRDKQILSRDITAVDLRVPDRVTVRLSDDAARARAEALKEKSKHKGGSV